MLDPCAENSEDIIGGAEIRGTDSKKQGWKHRQRIQKVRRKVETWAIEMKSDHCEPHSGNYLYLGHSCKPLMLPGSGRVNARQNLSSVENR